MNDNNQWIKQRHAVATAVLKTLLRPYVLWKYGIRMEPFRQQGRPYLILMNHQTGFDQFFVAMTFRSPVYYLATEDIFSMGWVSDVIRYLVAPIPIRKQTTDIKAVKNCIRVAREGGTLCIAPEGHRTFHGRTVYIKPSIASLAKKLKLPIAIFRLEGGYGIQPRWSDVVRKGSMRSFVSRVIEPEEYAGMTSEALARWLTEELYVDEARVTGTFRHKKNAEFLERVVYTCPWCGLSTFESTDDIIRCKTCNRQIRHLPTKELEGVDCDFPHRFVADWYKWQNDYVNQLDLMPLLEKPVWTETARLSRVHIYKYKELLTVDATVSLYGDRITVDDRVFPFESLNAVINLIAVLLVSLLAANMLKRSVPALQASLIPTSVLGGGILLVITYLYVNFVCRKLFPDYTEQQFLAMYGMLTGTASTGIILLREIDGDFKTPVADNLVYQNFPAMVFGFPILILATMAPTRPYLTLGIVAAFLVLINILLFRSLLFGKKRKGAAV